mmetsp:Transcript_14969/g.30514  ORF Transcript_14969/g.30514 Transcript_14969/m.30514 type:complete len:160 (-) Transcript_14969:114-593(-)
MKYGAMGLGGLIVLGLVVPGFLHLVILATLAVGLVLGYLHHTCPSDDSFDAKRELKRVLRGHHLAENDPHKPKGFWKRKMARLGASLQAEIPSAMGQHYVTIHPIATIAKVARIRVQNTQQEYTWIGLAGRWIFYQASDIAEEQCELTEQGGGGRGIVT